MSPFYVALVNLTPPNLSKNFSDFDYFNRLGVNAIREFFESFGRAYPDNHTGQLMRKVMKIDTAEEYIHFRKDKLDVFLVKSQTPSSQSIYLVIEEQQSVISIGGSATSLLLHEILPSLQISN